MGGRIQDFANDNQWHSGLRSDTLPAERVPRKRKGRTIMNRQRLWLAAFLCFGCGGFMGWWLGSQPPHLAAASSPAAPTARGVDRPAVPPEDGKLRIICFGAHPDDCELKAGGVTALWAAQGHHVKLVSVTNGDIGHWREAGGPLAKRRTSEVERAAKILGDTAEVLDIHDGELMPTLENRRLLTRLIREWKADIVMSHRPNDYHPDHRYTGVLIQDSAYMVAVPFICPDVPPLKSNPVFLFYSDGFQKPNPFQADIVVDIDPVMEKKLDALDQLESQFYEGGAEGSAALMPSDPTKQQERHRQIRDRFAHRDQEVAKRYRAQLQEWYGKERGTKAQHAEAFEICEYGRRPSRAELAKLFPFYGE
jgi:LmbE family N-acetylglucosaminyl deacetylase